MVAPAAPAVAPAATKEPAPGDPAWLAPRLDAAERAALRKAGFETPEEARAAADAIKAQKESQKSLETKLAEAQAIQEKLKGRSDAIATLLNEQVADSFAGLTEAQKTAVRLQAADDAPAEDRLKAIRQVKALTAALSQAAPQTAAPPATAAAQPAPAVAPPANTAPGRTAPSGEATSPPNHRAVYEQLQQTNPFQAAQYGLLHGAEVYKPAS
jgi:hypothetical protein